MNADVEDLGSHAEVIEASAAFFADREPDEIDAAFLTAGADETLDVLATVNDATEDPRGAHLTMLGAHIEYVANVLDEGPVDVCQEAYHAAAHAAAEEEEVDADA